MTRETSPQVDEAAARLLEAVPLLMRALRRQLRDGPSDTLSVPQFHALLYLRKHPGAGLSEVADYLGATLPTASELVNRMVAAELVSRSTNPQERRRVCLTVTAAGETLIDTTMTETRRKFAEVISRLDADRVRRLSAALIEIRELLAPED